MGGPARHTKDQAAAPLRPVQLGRLDPVIEQRAGGVIYIRAAQKLDRYHEKLTQALEHWAQVAPERLFLAQRNAQGEWRKLSYSRVLSDVRRIGAALLRRGLSAEKPVVVLSGTTSSRLCLLSRRCMSAFPMRQSRQPIH